MHFYERNIVEIKNEYTDFLTNIMTPLLYEGIKLIYTESLTTENRFIEACKSDSEMKNPGVFKIFQIYLKDIPKLNNNSIEQETNRIINGSKCADWFEDLVKAVIKSNIVLLTFNASEKKCKIVNDQFHKNIDIKLFVHKCYIECAKTFYNYPELFWHGFSTLDIKRNQREAYDLIKEAIKEAVRKMLPVKLILEEYLSKDYIQDNEDQSVVSEAKYMNLKTMLKRDLNGNKIIDEKDQGGGTYEQKNNNTYSIIDSDEEDSDIDSKIDDIEEDVKENDKIEELNNINDLVLDNHETNLNLSTINKPNISKTEEEKIMMSKDPTYITEPQKLKKSKDSLQEEIDNYNKMTKPKQDAIDINITIPKESLKSDVVKQENKDINIKINNKTNKEVSEKEYFDDLLKK
jgi:hypothetical protein